MICAQVHGSAILGRGIRGWYFENLIPFEEFCVRWQIDPALLSYTQLLGSLLVGDLLRDGHAVRPPAGCCSSPARSTSSTAASPGARTAAARAAHSSIRSSTATPIRSPISVSRSSSATRWVLWAVLFALLGGLIVSYTRARAEGAGRALLASGCCSGRSATSFSASARSSVRLLEHLTGPWLPGQHYSLVIFTIVFLAVLVNFTAVQRVVHVWRALGEEAGA